MQNTASIIRCPSVRRQEPCVVSGLAQCRRSVLFLALAAAALVQPAEAQVIVRDLQPVSMQLNSAAQNGIRAHQAQVRARQVRVRQASSQAAMPRLTNNLTMSSDQASIPLRLRDAPPAPSAGKKIAPSTVGVINTFIRGDLYTDADNDTASGLATTDLTMGSDYRVSEDLMFGLASGRLSTGDAAGATMSAYMTVQPITRIFLDLSLSYGTHHARPSEALAAAGPVTAAEAVSRSFSVSLNHPRQIGAWHWSPYSRYDRIVTDVDASGQSLASSLVPASYGLSAVSLGSTAATLWGTPFGPVRPIVMLELQKEVVTVAGHGTTSSLTQGVVGFGMTTKVSRDMSAFAESRYQSDLAATLDRQMMLGVKFAF